MGTTDGRAGGTPSRKPRPSRAELEAARNKVVPDLLTEDLHVLFCGINPGLISGAVGHHFANPGTRFWPALHGSGFTPRRLAPEEEDELLGLGLGITNVAARTTAQADELSREEIVEGGRELRRKVLRWRPDGWPSWASPPTGTPLVSATRRWVPEPWRSGPPGCGCCPIPAAATRTGNWGRSPRSSRVCGGPPNYRTGHRRADVRTAVWGPVGRRRGPKTPPDRAGEGLLAVGARSSGHRTSGLDRTWHTGGDRVPFPVVRPRSWSPRPRGGFRRHVDRRPAPPEHTFRPGT